MMKCTYEALLREREKEPWVPETFPRDHLSQTNQVAIRVLSIFLIETLELEQELQIQKLPLAQMDFSQKQGAHILRQQLQEFQVFLQFLKSGCSIQSVNNTNLYMIPTIYSH
jgi:hypothetical protein